MAHSSLFDRIPAAFLEDNSANGWLARFCELSEQAPSPLGVEGHACFRPEASSRTEHLVISFAVHGNEWGSLPAAVALLHGLISGQLKTRGPVSLLLGNLEAIRRGVRFVEEDYNRVFVFDQPAESLERRRAEEVRPVLDQADFLFDLHQTQTPTESAFWTFPWTQELSDWATIIGAAPRAMVRAPGGAFSPGKKCLDEYVRDRGKVGITAELGEKGPDRVQAQNAYDSCVRLMRAFDAVCTKEASVFDLAAEGAVPRWFETVDVVAPPSRKTRLRPGISCFCEVARGQVLSAEGSPELLAARDGYVMFPKYPPPGQEMPPEIYRLAVEIADAKERFGT